MRYIEPRRGVTRASAIDVPPRWGSGFAASYLPHGLRRGLQIYSRSRGCRTMRFYAVAASRARPILLHATPGFMLSRASRALLLLTVRTGAGIRSKRETP